MKKVTAYTVQELKEEFPEGYERAFEEWKARRDSEIPWVDEIMDSLKAIFEAGNVTLRDWSIGAYSPSYVTFSFYGDYAEEIGELNGARALGWIENNIISPNRIRRGQYNRQELRRYGYQIGALKDCPFTGVCFDFDMLESLLGDIQRGYTLREAFSGLASVASRLMESEIESATSEDAFAEDAEAMNRHYTEEGTKV